MSETTLEQRVAALERKVTELEAALANGSRKRNWQSTIGMFSGDDVMKRIDEEGRKWREGERAKARRKATKKRTAKA